MKQKKTGFRYKVIAWYDGPFGAKGTILSRHRSHELAEKAAKHRDPGGSWLGIREIDQHGGHDEN